MSTSTRFLCIIGCGLASPCPGLELRERFVLRRGDEEDGGGRDLEIIEETISDGLGFGRDNGGEDEEDLGVVDTAVGRPFDVVWGGALEDEEPVD